MVSPLRIYPVPSELGFSLLFISISHDTVITLNYLLSRFSGKNQNSPPSREGKKKGNCFLQLFPQLLSSSTIYFISLPCKQLQCLGAWAKPSPFVPCSHHCIFKGKLIPRNAVHAHTYLGAAPTPAHQVTQRPLALAATFQPAELLLANCYLSNK